MPAAFDIDSSAPAAPWSLAGVACRTLLVGALSLSLGASHVIAAPLGYSAMGELGDELVEIDMATGSLRSIGRFGNISGIPFGDVEGMALDNKGRLFAIADSSENLLRVDITNGAATSVGPLFGLGLRGQGAGALNQLDVGLAFTCDGRLWMSSDSVNMLWEVDLTTGVAMLVGSTGKKISGLAGYDNDLYGIGVEGDEGLYRIDRETAATTLIGRTGLGRAFYDAGLDFDADGNLWAVIDYNVPPSGQSQDFRASDIVQIDRLTGLVTSARPVLGPTTIQLESLAMAPTACISGQPPVEPEAVPVDTLGPRPLGLLVIGIGLLGLLGLRRRA